MAVSTKVEILIMNPKYKAIVSETMDSFNKNKRKRDVFSCDLSGKPQVLVQQMGNYPLRTILWMRKFKRTDKERRWHPHEAISITGEEWMRLKRNVASIDRAARKAAHSLRKWG